jgi:hypothetical protein
MIDEHFDMLQGMVDRGIAHNVEIHYNTNGTHFPARGEQIWRHFRTVEIAFSIDDVGDRFEYQRSGASWMQVCENLDRFRDLKEIYPCIRLQICTTVNVFNVFYLDQVASWLDHNAEGFDFVYWNVMHDAWYFSIACLPQSAKTAVQAHYDSVTIPVQYAEDIKKVLAFMHGGASTDGFMTCMKIRDLDQRRDTNLAHVAPALAVALDYAKA